MDNRLLIIICAAGLSVNNRILSIVFQSGALFLFGALVPYFVITLMFGILYEFRNRPGLLKNINDFLES